MDEHIRYGNVIKFVLIWHFGSDHNHTTNHLIWQWMRLVLADIDGGRYLLHLEFRIISIVALNMTICGFLVILLE